MEDKNPQELEKKENGTSREWLLRFSGRGCDLASEIVKNRRNHAGNRHFHTQPKFAVKRKGSGLQRKGLRKRKRLLEKKVWAVVFKVLKENFCTVASKFL